MRTEEEILADATDKRGLSNGTDWELFQFNVCMSASYDEARHCVHDNLDEPEKGCPLIGVMLLGKTPQEWVGDPPRRCTEKLTRAQQEAQRRKDAEAEQRRFVADSHYPMFEL